jgi:hypothetical protein
LGLSTSDGTDSSDDSDSQDDFSIDLDDGGEGFTYDTLIDALKDDTTKEDAIEALIEAALSAIEAEKGQKSGEASLKALAQANGKIASVDLTRAAPETYGKIKKQLDTIETLCTQLRAKLNELE